MSACLCACTRGCRCRLTASSASPLNTIFSLCLIPFVMNTSSVFFSFVTFSPLKETHRREEKREEETERDCQQRVLDVCVE